MKRAVEVLFCVTFSFLLCFMCIGFAQLTDSLTINGTGHMTEPEAVYITEIVSTMGNVSKADIVPLTSVNSILTLESDPTSTVTMTITVKNNTANTRYGFNAIRYINEAYSNVNIKVETNMTHKTVNNRGQVIDDGTVIEAGQTLTFTATFSYVGTDVSNPVLESVINYEFLPWDDITASVDAGVAGDVIDQFEDILNNVDHPDSFDSLLKQMQNGTEADRYSNDYIANFTDAYDGDKELLNELFGTDKLTVNINGEEVNVQIIIKYEDVTDAYTGNEMTMYMTTHSLTKSSAWSIENASPIYASVFSSSVVDGKTVWTQIGQMYTGQGRINGYGGSYFGEGSFDTGTWRSTQAYSSAQSGSTIEQVLTAMGY